MSIFNRYIVLISLISLFSSCMKEDEGSLSVKDRLRISAVALEFAVDGSPSTKTTNYGFVTAFEAGDCIGVFGFDKNGNVVDICRNVKFTFDKVDTDSENNPWSYFKNDRGYDFVERVDGAKYIAYYPYNSEWESISNLDEFNEKITNFRVQDDQSSKENFDKSDLMVPAEPIVPSDCELNFYMQHKMSSISIFYNNEWEPDLVTRKSNILLLNGTEPTTLKLNAASTTPGETTTYRAPLSAERKEHRHRYLINPNTTHTVKLVGKVEEIGHRYFSTTLDIKPGVLYSISFEGAPLVPYTDGVDMGLDNVEFTDYHGVSQKLGHTVIWSKYNLGESLAESYSFAPLSGERGTQNGSRDSCARGDYYAWGATYTQYDNGYTGYNGYGYNNYFDNEYRIAPLGGTIKETEYDVAHARWWRGKWRLPTENEFRALYAACTFEVIGTYRETNTRYIGSERATKTRSFSIIKVTSNVNGNVIYFSTGGYLDGTVEPTIGEDGKPTDSGDGKKNEGLIYTDNAYYLTSSSSHTILRCVSYAKFSAKLQEINLSGSRYTGMLVRPVYSPNEY